MAAFTLVATWPRPASAEEVSRVDARLPPGDRAGPTFSSLVPPPNRWTVGVVTERGIHAIVGRGLADDQLFGVSTTHYFGGGPLGVTNRIMVSPNLSNIVNTRAVFLGGVRLRKTIFGVESFLGTTAHLEARLRNHYWLAYVSPLEVGVTAYRNGSFRLQIFTGLRAIVAGNLVDNFLIDPNGVNNDSANDALRAEKRRPWEGYVTLVIGRAL